MPEPHIASCRRAVRMQRVDHRLRHTLFPVLTALSLAGCYAGGAPHGASAPATSPGYVDAAGDSGLNYAWSIPGKRPLNILQTIGNGCAFLDYDQDGSLDVLLVGPKLALFRGDGHGHFTDVTHETGLDRLSGHFLGCAVGDYDNDGYPDIYVSGYRTGVLLHNEAATSSDGAASPGERPAGTTPTTPGGGAARRTFRDVTREAGLKPQPWGTSCAWAETRPGCGRLDLYVCNYAAFGPDTVPQLCREHGVLTSCSPRDYKPIPGVLYLNQGGGRFQDATARAGMTTAHGRALGVAFLDYNGDGAPAAAIANDELPGDLFERTGSQSTIGQAPYVNVGERSGVAFDRDGNIHGGMGLDWGDVDNDGRPDLFVATFQNETKSLYHNESGVFRDIALAAGIGENCIPNVAFGCKFLDYDNDGWLDIAIANGHVEDNVHKIVPAETYRQSAQLLHNLGTSPISFADVSHTVGGAALTKPIVGRGLAVGDYDNSGRIDILLVDSEGGPILLHNQVAMPDRHFLGVRLIGSHTNRDGYGATVIAVLANGRRLVRYCRADGSYMSSSDVRVHFGLGNCAHVASLIVKWPDGRQDQLLGVQADRYVTVREVGASG